MSQVIGEQEAPLNPDPLNTVRIVCEECGAIFEGELAEVQTLRLEEHQQLHFDAKSPRDPMGDLLEAWGIDRTSKTFREHMGVFMSAMRIYAERWGRYGDGWKRYGWLDSFFHIRNKFLRMEAEYWDNEPSNEEAQALIDNPKDMLNYVVFFIRNVNARNRKGIGRG